MQFDQCDETERFLYWYLEEYLPNFMGLSQWRLMRHCNIYR